MTLQDFMIETRREIELFLEANELDNIVVDDGKVVKTNDSILHGFVLRKEGSGIGANVYIDDLFDRHESGESMEELRGDLEMRCLQAATCPIPPLHRLEDLSLDSVRTRLTVRLLDVRNNRTYMEERPYIDVGNGLALVADINCDETITSEWKIAVNEGILQEMGCSKEELLTAALENTIALEPPIMADLARFMDAEVYGGLEPENLLDVSEHGDAVYRTPGFAEGAFVLTNTSRFRGAAVLFYPEVMDRIHEVLGCGYYVIPSSVHEVILVPDASGWDVRKLKEMLRQGNEETVGRGDYLSDRVFHYGHEDRHLRIAA